MDWVFSINRFVRKMAENGWVEFMVYILLGWVVCYALRRIFKKLEQNEKLPQQVLVLLLQ